MPFHFLDARGELFDLAMTQQNRCSIMAEGHSWQLSQEAKSHDSL